MNKGKMRFLLMRNQAWLGGAAPVGAAGLGGYFTSGLAPIMER
jgi:hypothetical protein